AACCGSASSSSRRAALPAPSRRASSRSSCPISSKCLPPPPSCRACGGSRAAARADPSLLAGLPHEDERRDVLAAAELQPRGAGGRDPFLWTGAFLGRRSGPARAGIEVDDAESSLRLERSRDVSEQRDNRRWIRGIFHLAVRIDNQRRVDPVRQTRIGRRSE